jgi:hypothetical protein
MRFTAFRVYHITAQTLLSCLQQLNTTNARPRSRRPRVTTARKDRNMYFTAFRDNDSTVQLYCHVCSNYK